jgi:hypothetical protein
VPEHEENRFQDCTGQRYYSTKIYRTSSLFLCDVFPFRRSPLRWLNGAAS